MKTAKKFMALIIIALFAVFACSAVAIAANTASASAETVTDVEVVSTYGAEDEEEGAIVTYADTATDSAESESSDSDATSGDEGSSESDATSGKAIAAAIAIGLAGLGGAIAMGLAIAKAMEGISRQPEAAGSIRSTMMLGLVFVETVVIYALIVSILLVFVL